MAWGSYAGTMAGDHSGITAREAGDTMPAPWMLPSEFLRAMGGL